MAVDLVEKVYPIVDSLPEKERNNIADQMRRAVTSLPLNIAEGAGAVSTKVFFNHLNYAYGSSKELEALFILSERLGYLDKQTFDSLKEDLDKFTGSLFNFIQNVERDTHTKRRNFTFLKTKGKRK